jgi:hypothetical protein
MAENYRKFQDFRCILHQRNRPLLKGDQSGILSEINKFASQAYSRFTVGDSMLKG